VDSKRTAVAIGVSMYNDAIQFVFLMMILYSIDKRLNPSDYDYHSPDNDGECDCYDCKACRV
jgi:hypothetical protein